MDRFHVMAMFVRVVETGSFSAAAREMRMGQPSVSKAIAGLEDVLGVRLLTRTSRNLSVTDAGRAYHLRARRALDEADAAEQAARGLAQGFEGQLRVCTPVTLGRLNIVPHLAGFLEAHPRLAIDMVMDDQQINLIEHNIDVAFRLGPLDDSSLTARKIVAGTRVLVAAPSYLARHGTPSEPRDLPRHQTLVFAPSSASHDWHLRRGGETVSIEAKGRLRFTAAEGLRAALLAGLGIALTSRWMVARELESGAVLPLLPEWSLPPVELWALYPAGRLPTARARAFADWVATVMTSANR